MQKSVWKKPIRIHAEEYHKYIVLKSEDQDSWIQEVTDRLCRKQKKQEEMTVRRIGRGVGGFYILDCPDSMSLFDFHNLIRALGFSGRCQEEGCLGVALHKSSPAQSYYAYPAWDDPAKEKLYLCLDSGECLVFDVPAYGKDKRTGICQDPELSLKPGTKRRLEAGLFPLLEAGTFQEYAALRIGELLERTERFEAENNIEPEPLSRKRFALLLGGLSAMRKTPGIRGHMGFQDLLVLDQEDAGETKDYLYRTFDIRDEGSLKRVCRDRYSSADAYEDFVSFWKGSPSFLELELTAGGKLAFHQCMDFAANFRGLVGTTGFYAWDFNERIGLIRACCASGMIEKEKAWEMLLPMAKKAVRVYRSWKEYAVSCLCGAAYFMYRESGHSDKEARIMFDRTLKQVESLLCDHAYWSYYQWGYAEENTMEK